MGYYTDYDLSEINNDYYEELEGLYGYNIDSDGEVYQVKWYKHLDDMKAFSSRHPDKVFVTSGKGEESGDLWKAYFKNGKMQYEKAKISYKGFNEFELK